MTAAGRQRVMETKRFYISQSKMRVVGLNSSGV